MIRISTLLVIFTLLISCGTGAENDGQSSDIEKTTSFSELTDQIDDSQIPDDIVRNSELEGLEEAINALPQQHSKTSSFSELSGQISDSQIPNSIARNSQLSWNNLQDIPADFADGTDSDSGGDITEVSVGRGLSGGGTQGNVSVELEVPMELIGFDSFTPTMTVSNSVKGGKAAEFFGKVDVTGNADVTGNLNVTGSITGTFAGQYDGTVDISQITGLLGQGHTMHFPDVLDNLASLELPFGFEEDVVIISGPGVDIEVVPGFYPDGSGKPWDKPGLNAEHPFIIETGNENDVANLITFFDDYHAGTQNLQNMPLIIDDGSGLEYERVNLYEYAPDFYEDGLDGRTRFYWRQYEIPNNILRWGMDPNHDLFRDNGSFNPATDKKVEVTGESGANFFPEVVDDPVNRTLTLTFDYNEGAGMMDWVKGVATNADQYGLKSLSVIDWDGSIGTNYTNYFETFPIKFEVSGYGLNTKLVGKIVIKYNWSEFVPG